MMKKYIVVSHHVYEERHVYYTQQERERGAISRDIALHLSPFVRDSRRVSNCYVPTGQPFGFFFFFSKADFRSLYITTTTIYIRIRSVLCRRAQKRLRCVNDLRRQKSRRRFCK